ncbi:hypothetical protein EVAR_44447_1 [Eumeta japonica]|uniref:Uncharacterized protein n=1 Tax=Eumeta variegata TaxID=151549 RepID=A0A4C1WLU8_EUMVA|nr:hypothetical protein EVAR_44447_1 [Eumeta japonica]
MLFEVSAIMRLPLNIDDQSFSQFVFDNADFNTQTDGHNTFHAMVVSVSDWSYSRGGVGRLGPGLRGPYCAHPQAYELNRQLCISSTLIEGFWALKFIIPPGHFIRSPALGGIHCITSKSAIAPDQNIERLKQMPSAKVVSSFGATELKTFTKKNNTGLKTIKIQKPW